MSDVPEPLVPADVDLRGYEFMPLYGDRLLGSETWITASAEGKVAAVRLWWRAYAKEVPAASLPDDDKLLADYAGYGNSHRTWARLRSQALRGFVKCSDGRLYHRVLAPLAIEAWEFRQSQSAKARKRWPGTARGGAAASGPELPGLPAAGAAAMPGQDRTERGQDKTPRPPINGEDPFLLPSSIDPKIWSAFEQHRKEAVKVPLTDLARKLTVEKLLEYARAGDDPNAVLKQSIELGYRGVFPLKGASKNGSSNREEAAASVRKEAERKLFGNS